MDHPGTKVLLTGATGYIGRRPDRLQTIWFRAGMIIGSGSACFEIIRNLIQKMPVLIAPKWMMTRRQPIAVDDVLAYLPKALDAPIQGNLLVDIGGGPLSFREMLREAARVMGLRRLLIPVPAAACFCLRQSRPEDPGAGRPSGKRVDRLREIFPIVAGFVL